MKGFQFCWCVGINIEDLDTKPKASAAIVRVFEDDSTKFPEIIDNTWYGNFKNGRSRPGLFKAIKKLGVGWHRKINEDYNGLPVAI